MEQQQPSPPMLSRYQPSDREALLRLFRDNIPLYFAPHELHEFAGYLDRFGDTYYTVWQGGKPAGGVGYQYDAGLATGSITWIFIDPELQGKGLGSAAIAHMLQLLGEQPGIRRLTVSTSQHAWKAFEKFGFRLAGTITDYWAPGLDLYRMERES